MEIKTTQDIEKIVKEFAETTITDELYLTISGEFVDGIDKWLHEYVYTIAGEWLSYDLKESFNETEIYILHLYSRW